MGRFILCFAVILLATCTIQDKDVTKTKTRFGDRNLYLVYTRDNPREAERIQPTAVSVSTFRNFRSKTVIIVHDHEGNAFNTLNPTLKDAFLASEDVSVIIVDWSTVAQGNYDNAASAAPLVGEGIADLIFRLVQYNRVNLQRLHLVGYGLGAHIVAFAARATNGQVARITALDPVRNRWGSNSERLRQSDASYVEVIHTDTEDGTDSPAIGIREPLGHVDFFPNPGPNQPGCLTDHECNHKRAWELLAASLTHNSLVGNQCDDDEGDVLESRCRGYTLPLGNNEMNKYGTGVFFLETGRTYPYENNQNCLLPCVLP